MKIQKAPTTLRVRLTETHTFTRYFEVASWYELVECPPQEHSVHLRGGNDYLILFNGTTAKRHTPSRFGTYTTDNPRDDEAKGAPAHHSLTIDAWHIQRIIETLDDPTAPFTINDTAPILINAVELD